MAVLPGLSYLFYSFLLQWWVMTDNLDLDNPDYYINREMSLFQFNLRVLEQAFYESVPLLERLNFLLIFSRNIDEFFEIRIAGLKMQLKADLAKTGPDGLLPQEILKNLSGLCHDAEEKKYRLFNEVLLPALEEEQIHILRRNDWDEKQSNWIKRYFKAQVAPVLTPIGLDLAHPFPRLTNKSLNFIVSLEGKDAFGRQLGLAIVPAPRSLPRVIALPDSISPNKHSFVFLSSIIHEHASSLFPGMTAKGCYQFRLTRNADFNVDEDEVKNLPDALKGELFSRQYGEAVRLEISDKCPQSIIDFLLIEFNLSEDDLYKVNGPVNLGRMGSIFSLDMPDLKYPEFVPKVPKEFISHENFFDVIKHQDLLLHHPYESFLPVVDFLASAAQDPDVVAIKATLYRTGPNSQIVKHLIEAAKNGKEVAVVVELKARFDEESNIHLADRLQEAGAVVVYGIVGYKTHAKMLLVVRKEDKKLKRYVHLGTGNYHEGNARLYTDYSLFSCDEELCEDVHKLFQELTGMGRVLKMKKMYHAPFTLHSNLIKFIENEAENARKGLKAEIKLKMNALTEADILKALYKASQAGVSIKLVIRSICCLKPGIKGLSENIRVITTVDRFLEHSRIYYFYNNKEPLIFCSSADGMERNMHSRVEAFFPVSDTKLAERVKTESFSTFFSNNKQTWILLEDGSYKQLSSRGVNAQSPQQVLLTKLATVSHQEN